MAEHGADVRTAVNGETKSRVGWNHAWEDELRLMPFLFGGSDRQQLDRIEKAVGQLTEITLSVKEIVERIDERTKIMAQQEQDLNAALQEFFTTINDGLTRIEEKLSDLPQPIDLSDEISAIKDAQAAFQQRIDADTTPPA